jgi:transcriptional regulator with XRE-family HTH domain
VLRELREQSGSSLRAVANDLGIAPSHLSRIERGEKGGSPALVAKVADYYGVDKRSIGTGELPSDIVRILLETPGLVEELRDRYGPRS